MRDDVELRIVDIVGEGRGDGVLVPVFVRVKTDHDLTRDELIEASEQVASRLALELGLRGDA